MVTKDVITWTVWPGLAATPNCFEKVSPDGHICYPVSSYSESGTSEFQGHQKMHQRKPKVFLWREFRQCFWVSGQAWHGEYFTLHLCKYAHRIFFIETNQGMGTTGWIFASEVHPAFIAPPQGMSDHFFLQLSNLDLLQAVPEHA